MATPTRPISVIERRLQGGNVFRAASQPIPLVDPEQWTLRWENSAISPGHMWTIIHQLGWVYAEPADLVCPVEEIGASVRDGRIVRGERGQEILMKMGLKDWERVQKTKDRENRRQTFGTQQVKAAMVAGVAAEHGDQAAEFIAQNVHAITVTDRRAPEDA